MAAQAQWLTSSNLPIVIITTDLIPGSDEHYDIPDEPKVPARMKILYVSDTTRNYLSNQDDTAFLNYSGRIGIELRGSTSQGHNKKPYGFETRMDDDVTNRNVSLLGMPEENDWILNPMNDDPSFLRDCLSYRLYAAMGHYAPRTRYCEVIVNGDYRGLYFLTEKIKIDKNRVDIVQMDSTENGIPEVSGGYIVKADKLTGGDVAAWTTPAHDYWEDVNYIYHNPKPANITLEQGNYIGQYFASVFQTIGQQDEDVSTGFPALIDIPSFINYYIIQEITKNPDGNVRKSTYLTKEKGKPLEMYHVWDFDITLGNCNYTNFEKPEGWQMRYVKWYNQMFFDPDFKKAVVDRWNKLYPDLLAKVPAFIDRQRALMDGAEQANFERWPILGVQVWPNYYAFPTYEEELDFLKTFYLDRLAWLNAMINSDQF